MEIRSIRKVRFCPHLYVQKHTRLKSQNKNVSKNMECGYGVFSTTKKKRKCFCTNAKTAKVDEIVYCAFQPLSLFVVYA